MATTQSTEIERLLASVDHTKFSSYQAFMRALILEGISWNNLSFEDLNYQLFKLNKEVYEALCQTALGYFDMYATEKIKSFGV